MENVQPFGMTPIEAEVVCIVYDAETGAIRHRHHVTTLKGGYHPSVKELEEHALHHAGVSEAERDRLRVLHLDPKEFVPGRTHRVDVERRTLVDEGKPTRKR